jgi:hypothetical protein
MPRDQLIRLLADAFDRAAGRLCAERYDDAFAAAAGLAISAFAIPIAAVELQPPSKASD